MKNILFKMVKTIFHKFVEWTFWKVAFIMKKI